MDQAHPSLARGALGGIAGTLTMTGAMLLMQKLGLLGRMPPSIITRKLLRRLGVPRHRPAENALSTLNHFGYGAAAGAGYALLDRVLPRGLPAAIKGALFGALVWTLSYMAWVPALDLMPHPKRDRPGRPTAMLLAHLVYGGTLASVAQHRQAGEASAEVARGDLAQHGGGAGLDDVTM